MADEIEIRLDSGLVLAILTGQSWGYRSNLLPSLRITWGFYWHETQYL